MRVRVATLSPAQNFGITDIPEYDVDPEPLPATTVTAPVPPYSGEIFLSHVLYILNPVYRHLYAPPRHHRHRPCWPLLRSPFLYVKMYTEIQQ